MEFWLSGSHSHELLFFHDGILAIRKPFTRTFLFSRWNSGYQEAFHTNFSFFTMEFWLLGSLSYELFFFSRWNSGYHGAFSRIFLSHDGISAITEPFHEFFFHMMEFQKMHDVGEDSFHIYHKDLYIGSASLKTLPLDLEPPLQGKEYGPPYSNVIAKKKTNFFPFEITYRLVIRPLGFLECKLTKKGKLL
jgi:hypothetical protein